MSRPRAADDFPAIQARIEELRRERNEAQQSETPQLEPKRAPGFQRIILTLDNPNLDPSIRRFMLKHGLTGRR